MKTKILNACLAGALMLASAAFTGCASKTKTKELTPAQKKARLYYNQGTRDLITQDYTRALSSLMEAASLDPKNSDIHNNLGMAYYFKNSRAKAIAHIKKAIELDPKNTDAKLNLATVYMAQNELSLAEGLYLQILEDLIYEGQHRTHYNLGLIELRRGNPELAAGQFRKALEYAPNYCPAHYRLANMAYDSGNYRQALQSYTSAGMGTCVENPEPLRGQIESLIKLQRYPDALSKLKDMQERFAMTEHESYARKTILRVRELQTKEDNNAQSYSKRVNRQIKAVGF